MKEDERCISIRYRLRGEKEWHEIELTAQEYFEYEPGESQHMAVPKHNHAVKYLEGISVQSVEKTLLQVVDPSKDSIRRVSQFFWNESRNDIIRVEDSEDGQRYQETILTTTVRETPRMREIVRFGQSGDEVTLYFHVFIRDNPDGSQSELKVYPQSESQNLEEFFSSWE